MNYLKKNIDTNGKIVTRLSTASYFRQIPIVFHRNHSQTGSDYYAQNACSVKLVTKH